MLRSTVVPGGDVRKDHQMARKRRYLTATLPDGYVKTIGPTADPFTHYWRIVAELASGKTDVFWGHTKTLAEAKGKSTATRDAAAARGWRSHVFEIVELVESDVPPDAEAARRRRR